MQDRDKICFIMCCNNSQYQKECISYLEELDKPKGYEIEILPVTGAKSMASGYNQGMRQSDAKYKVYLHQDVFIWNRRFLYDLLEIFRDVKIGMFGVLGGTFVPNNGILYSAWNTGRTYACDTQAAGVKEGDNPAPGICQEVKALDGMLMAAQYDIPWREDLFDKWDFYDIAQSFEFRKQGYLLVVPHQKKPWCMHDCGRTKLQDYNEGRRILLQEYSMFFEHPVYRQEDFFYNQELRRLYDKLKETIAGVMELGNVDMAAQCCAQYDDEAVLDSDLSILKKLVSVCEAERELYGESLTWRSGDKYESVRQKYHQVKFWLWDAERNRTGGKERLKEVLRQDQYSMPLLVMEGLHNTCHFEELLCLMAQCMQGGKSEKSRKNLQYLEFILRQMAAADHMN